MHPECVWYNYFISRGHNILRKLEFSKRKTQRQAYLTRTGPTKPLFESISSRTSIQLGFGIMSDGCGLSTLARSLDYASIRVIRWCYKLVVELGPEKQSTSYCHSLSLGNTAYQLTTDSWSMIRIPSRLCPCVCFESLVDRFCYRSARCTLHWWIYQSPIDSLRDRHFFFAV